MQRWELGIPRLLFDVKTDKSMESKFGKSTIDVLLVQDSTDLCIMEVLRYWRLLEQANKIIDILI
jgi:lysyl-tRNA synthetase class I